MSNIGSLHRIAAAGALLLAGSAHALAQGSALGIEATSSEAACLLNGPAHDEPLPILVTVDPEALHDPASLDALLACAPEHHLEIVIRLEPPVEWLKAPDPYAALRDWIADLDRFLHDNRDRLRHFELGRRPDLIFEPNAYAYLVERVGTSIHAADPSFDLLIGPLADGSGNWLAAIDPARLTPYIHGLAIEDPKDPAEAAARLQRDYPGMALWLHAAPQGSDAAVFVRLLYEARVAGFQRVFAGSGAPSDLVALLLNIAVALPARFEPDPAPSVKAYAHTGAPPAWVGYFADPLSSERALLLPEAPSGPPALEPATIARLRVIDLATGADLPAQPGAPAAAGPLLLRFLLMQEPRAAPETIGVTEERRLTASEIIARHRAFEAAQARGLSHYQAKATISYHYRAESLGESIDVASVNRFFWKDGVGEYEEIDLYVNGARWRGKPPSLPFIAAEKVKEVPLEIRLDQSYRYTLRGNDRINGRDAYLIAFAPVQADRALYSGEAWIDTETFARLKVRFLQHALKEPISSNEDTIEYRAVEEGHTGAAGPARSWWLPVSAYRQMVFTVLGRSVVVERRVAWEEFAINAPVFEQGREQAYASGRPILRDDETGYSYLVKEGDVIRTRQAESLRNVALFGGIALNSDLSLGTPFAGLNYFDFDWRGSGTQLDVAFAGPLLDVAWTDPAVGKSRWDISVEGRVAGLPGRFKKVTSSGRQSEEDLKVLEERIYFTVGHHLGPYQKIDLQTELAYDNFSRASGANPDFVLPPTRPVATATTRWRYLRAGTSLDLWFSHGRRLGWGDWGIPPDPNLPASTTDEPSGGSGDDLSFQRWGMGLVKSFYPGRLQKVTLGGALLAGRHLDRFSRFRIGEFRNARVRGFNGFDITFDRGATAQVEWKFSLPRGGASVELSLEGAVIENDEDFHNREYLAGGGLAVSFTGPWGTLMSLRSGAGLGASIDVRSSGASVRLVIIKTWDHWPFHSRRRTGRLNPA